MSLEQKKFVIAGGSGFPGVSLAHYLAKRGAAVVIISQMNPKWLVCFEWPHLEDALQDLLCRGI